MGFEGNKWIASRSGMKQTLGQIYSRSCSRSFMSSISSRRSESGDGECGMQDVAGRSIELRTLSNPTKQGDLIKIPCLEELLCLYCPLQCTAENAHPCSVPGGGAISIL